MTSRLLPPLLLLLLLLPLISLLAIVDVDAAVVPKKVWSEDSNDATTRSSVAERRQHKAFFLDDYYPSMHQQRGYKGNDLEASESRNKRRRNKQKPRRKPESDIYFIKLPPAPYSYVEGLGYISQPPVFSAASLPKPRPKPKPKPFVKLPIDFVSNGKPTKVYQVDTPVIRLNRGPYLFNGNPTGVYVIKKKPKRNKPVIRTSNEYKKKVVVKQ